MFAHFISNYDFRSSSVHHTNCDQHQQLRSHCYVTKR